MKILITILLVFSSFCATDAAAFVTSNSVLPQYFAKKTVEITDTVRRFHKTTDTPIQLNKLAGKSLGFGFLSPIVFVGFISLLISIGEATLIGLFISLTLAILAILMGNRILRNPTATLNARKKARLGKGLGIFTISLLVVLLTLLMSFA